MPEGNIWVMWRCQQNKKSLSRGCTVFIENAWVVLPSVTLRALRYRTCVQYINPAEQLFWRPERNCSFYLRLSHFIPIENQRKFSDHESNSSSFLRNFGARNAAWDYLSGTHKSLIGKDVTNHFQGLKDSVHEQPSIALRTRESQHQ